VSNLYGVERLPSLLVVEVSESALDEVLATVT
jgi:hypothetical protein